MIVFDFEVCPTNQMERKINKLSNYDAKEEQTKKNDNTEAHKTRFYHQIEIGLKFV